MDRWKGMESWLRIHYFDHFDSMFKQHVEGRDNAEDASGSLLHARCVICILNGAGATPVGLEADLEVKGLQWKYINLVYKIGTKMKEEYLGENCIREY